MVQEDKQLLLKDLCARLPYNVMINCTEEDDEKTNFDCFLAPDMIKDIKSGTAYWITKPYLRPMSSMTEEEKEEIAFIRDIDFQSVRKWFRDESIKETGNICPITCGEIDFCNKKHLDYRGLIPMGLALKAPKGMYNINEK